MHCDGLGGRSWEGMVDKVGEGGWGYESSSRQSRGSNRREENRRTEQRARPSRMDGAGSELVIGTRRSSQHTEADVMT